MRAMTLVMAVGLLAFGCSKKPKTGGASTPTPVVAASPDASPPAAAKPVPAVSGHDDGAGADAGAAMAPALEGARLAVVRGATADDLDDVAVGTGLPGLTPDGKTIVLAQRDEDGERGAPNLTLWFLDVATDKVSRKVVIMTSEESARDGGVPRATLEARVSAANSELAKLGLVGLTHHPRPCDGTANGCGVDGDPVEVEVDKLKLAVRYQEPTLTLTPTGGMESRPKLRKVPGWSAKPHQIKGGMPCRNPSVLGAVYSAPEQRLLLLMIDYRGSDDCEEPSSQWHVVKAP